MKLRSYVSTSMGLVALTFLGWSCDWTGGSSDDFNTSGGATSVSISGFYSGVLGSGLAVSNTSGGNITSLTIQQSGNVVNVTDSNGQNYRGQTGSPLSLARPDDAGVLPAGATLANFQVSWAGKDGVAQRDVSFSGVISVVTINSIQGESTVTSRVADSAESVAINSDNNSQVVDTRNAGTDNNSQLVNTRTDGSSLVAQTTETTDATSQGQQAGFDNNGQPTLEGENASIVRTTTVARNNANTNTQTINQNQINAQNSTGTTNSNQSNVASNTRGTTANVTTTTENTFQLTDANTQYRLRGNWVENGGVSATVDAVAAGAGGFISTFDTN